MDDLKHYVSAAVKVAESRVVNKGNTIKLSALVLVAVFVLFEVTFPLDVASPYESVIPDPAVEAEYLNCYEEKDKAMHRVAFSTIDNPDVQKEYISTNRDRIARECRLQFPEELIKVLQPARFNLVDFEPRFW